MSKRFSAVACTLFLIWNTTQAFAESPTAPAQQVSVPEISCKSESAGLPFTSSDHDSLKARALVLDACNSDYRTDGKDCLRNIECSDGYRGADAGAIVTCVSNSRDKYFIRRHSDLTQAKEKSVRACTDKFPKTNRLECKTQLMCYQVAPESGD